MDINVKNLEAEVVARLAEQAQAEGMSQQEWIRQTLRRTSARLSPAELLTLKPGLDAMTDDEFLAIRDEVAKGRRAGLEGLRARQRRR
jgi:hypothetical protein